MDEERAIDSSAWDGGAAMKACSSAADFNQICAGKKAGDPALRSSHALPHHYLGKGPNADGVRAARQRFSATQGLTNRAEAESHLEKHMSEIQARDALPTDDLFRAVFPGVELREESPGGPPVLHSRFAPYDEWTEIDSEREGRFLERFAPGAFTASLARYTPKILFQHGRDPELGDKVIAGPAVFREEADGAHLDAPLFPGLPELLVAGLRANQYGASERFNVPPGGQEVVWEPKRSDYNPEGLPERTITAANVLECGPVTFPAYSGATAVVRSLTDQFRPRRLTDEEVDELILKEVNEHPKQFALAIQRALKSTPTTEEKPLEEKPPVIPRFRTREEYLQWISTT